MLSSMIDAGANPYLPVTAKIIQRTQESADVFTWQLQLQDALQRDQYHFEPGQFNMLYLFGAGEIPVSIVSRNSQDQTLEHTIRSVGRVTEAFSRLETGNVIGLRGPYGRGWPMQQAKNKNVVIITGGLGCAPSVSIIKSIIENRGDYGALTILQGVKHAEDFIWRSQYETWEQQPDTQVHLAADVASSDWHGHTGLVTSLFDQAQLNGENAIVMLCGPEPMMHAASESLLERGFEAADIWLSMERNMQCGVGHCGHCQIGEQFVCRDGPVFSYPEIAHWLTTRGF